MTIGDVHSKAPFHNPVVTLVVSEELVNTLADPLREAEAEKLGDADDGKICDTLCVLGTKAQIG